MFPAFSAIQPGIVNNNFNIHPKTIITTFIAYLFIFWLLIFFSWFFPSHNIQVNYYNNWQISKNSIKPSIKSCVPERNQLCWGEGTVVEWTWKLLFFFSCPRLWVSGLSAYNSKNGFLECCWLNSIHRVINFHAWFDMDKISNIWCDKFHLKDYCRRQNDGVREFYFV